EAPVAGNEFGSAARCATLSGFRHLDPEEFEHHAPDCVPVEPEVGRRPHPVAPNRSVLTDSGGYPSSTSPSAAASTKRVEPQMKTCGCSAAGQATSCRRSWSIRREYPVQPGGWALGNVDPTSPPLSERPCSSAR